MLCIGGFLSPAFLSCRRVIRPRPTSHVLSSRAFSTASGCLWGSLPQPLLPLGDRSWFLFLLTFHVSMHFPSVRVRPTQLLTGWPRFSHGSLIGRSLVTASGLSSDEVEDHAHVFGLNNSWEEKQCCASRCKTVGSDAATSHQSPATSHQPHHRMRHTFPYRRWPWPCSPIILACAQRDRVLLRSPLASQ